jgi:hypothetical protein
LAGGSDGFGCDGVAEFGLGGVFAEDAVEDELLGGVLGVVEDGDRGRILPDRDV